MDSIKGLWSKAWQDVAAIVLFVLIPLVYFFMPVTQGLMLTGHDNTGGIGSGREIAQYKEQTGETTRWTNALFGGMPTYQISPSYGTKSVLNVVRDITRLGMDGPVMYVFTLLIGFYILLRVLRLKPLIAVVGAVAWAFSSYYFIIIAAGHIWKVMTLAYIPPTIAGVILCYRGRLLWGSVVTALFMALQIYSNHIQMTYYFLFVMAFIAIAFLVDAIRNKTIPAFVKATVVLLIAGSVGALCNLPNLYHTYTYNKETMRGGASISSSISGGQKGGLDRDYITQWSYGVGETWTLLVPNVKGGASVALSQSETAMKKADAQYSQLYSQVGQYWGEQPGTSGPVYVGALICFLFVLGLFVVKGSLKWALLAATVLSIVLSWGHNCPSVTNWFIDNFPLYNKFRTPSSILVITEFAMPLLAILALAEILRDDKFLSNHKRAVILSLVVTGGVALLFAVIPSAFFSSYISTRETAMFNSYFGQNPTWLQGFVANLSECRRAMFTADAWRSVVIIVLGCIVLLLRKHIGKTATVVLVGLICLVDLYQVDRRYLNDDNFAEPETRETNFAMTATDQAILQDESLDYRVLNFSTNTFNENETSYWHKSIGGYHPAKLGRYQDIIENNLVPEMNDIRGSLAAAGGVMTDSLLWDVCPVVNMLNTRYFIFALQDGSTAPVKNPSAMGNAWFATGVVQAATAQEEMARLKTEDLRQTAIVAAGDAKPVDGTGTCELTTYAPNELTYSVEAEGDGLVVFSEIYYPGWKATLDGEPLDIIRADYILRAAYVPAGKHTIRMEYKPASVASTEAIAYAAIALMILSLLAALLLPLRKQKEVKK